MHAYSGVPGERKRHVLVSEGSEPPMLSSGSKGRSEQMAVNFLNAVLIVSEEPKRLADWYREVLGLPLTDDQHDGGGGALHFGCNLRGLHLAIHPTANYSFAPETGRGGI